MSTLEDDTPDRDASAGSELSQVCAPLPSSCVLPGLAAWLHTYGLLVRSTHIRANGGAFVSGWVLRCPFVVGIPVASIEADEGTDASEALGLLLQRLPPGGSQK
jgi:hypothetical protein